jgi:hypothetical protein
VNNNDSSSRLIASANLLTYHRQLRRTQVTYVGVALSFLDPLAPLSELALRKTDKTHYDRINNLLTNVITPRFELVAGSPALSEHLAVSAGLSLRLAAPILDPAATKLNGEPSYNYSMVWDAKDEQNHSLFFRFLEFGFAAKYVL